MTYAIKTVFPTLQGEGAQAGHAAVFLRFAGCNLWSGREADRETAICSFCDTEFVGTDGEGGGRFEAADELADHVAAHWPADEAHRLVVCTGGEPALQLDRALIDALHQRGFRVAVETNGTVALPTGIDWICVSPKAGTRLVVRRGDELKLVYPQPSLEPAELEGLSFTHFFLQPMDGPDRQANTRAAIEYCQRHPQWRLSVQAHKVLGIP